MVIAEKRKKTHISEYCILCGACQQACPREAITIEYSAANPEIVVETEKCIGCGLCDRVCPVELGQAPNRRVSISAFFGIERDEQRKKSASGGAFYAIAKTVLLKGGSVYGAAWRSDWRVEQTRITQITELERLQGSKYLKSNPKNTYKEALDDLKSGRSVLYSGTPCIIAGLLGYLSKDYDNLITVDVVCHGTPSQIFFQDYIRYRSQKEHVQILDYCFRSHNGRNNGCYGRLKLKKGNREIEKPLLWQCDSYYYFYMHAMFYQEHCYRCPYARRDRISDITLGDFWGIEKVLAGKKAGSVSLILANSEKGLRQIENTPSLISEPVEVEQACNGNGQLNHPSECPQERADIIRGYEIEGYDYLQKRFDNLPKAPKLKAVLAFYTPSRIKKTLHCIVGK